MSCFRIVCSKYFEPSWAQCFLFLPSNVLFKDGRIFLVLITDLSLFSNLWIFPWKTYITEWLRNEWIFDNFFFHYCGPFQLIRIPVTKIIVRVTIPRRPLNEDKSGRMAALVLTRPETILNGIYTYTVLHAARTQPISFFIIFNTLSYNFRWTNITRHCLRKKFQSLALKGKQYDPKG